MWLQSVLCDSTLLEHATKNTTINTRIQHGQNMCVLFFACFISGKKLFIRFSYSQPNGEGCPVFFCPAIRSKIALQNGIVIRSRQDAPCRHGTAETASGKYFDIGQTTSHQQFIAHGSVGSLHTVSRSLAIVKRFCVCYSPGPSFIAKTQMRVLFALFRVCACVCVCVRVRGAD